MTSFFILTLLATYVHGCSLLEPDAGTLYITNASRLKSDSDSLLITIDSSDIAPFCKVLDLKTSTLGDSVRCSLYTDGIPDYSSPDDDPTETSIISFKDNCDNPNTATITVQRNQEQFTVDVAYERSDLTSVCDSSGDTIMGFGGLSYFTVNTYNTEDIHTTFVSYGDYTYAIAFTGIDNNEIVNTYDVTIVGTLPDSDGKAGMVYESVNIWQQTMPCCLCYGYSLTQYTISQPVKDGDAYTLSLESVTGGGGNVDVDNKRVISVGLGIGQIVYIYNIDTTSRRRLVTENTIEFIQDDLACTCANVQSPCENAKCEDAKCEASCCWGVWTTSDTFVDVTEQCISCNAYCFVDLCEEGCKAYPDAECDSACCVATWINKDGTDVACDDSPAPTTPSPVDVTCSCLIAPCDEDASCSDYPDAKCTADCCDEVWTDNDGTDVTGTCNPIVDCLCVEGTKTCDDFDECRLATCSRDCCTIIWTDDDGDQYEECPDCTCLNTPCDEKTCFDYSDATCTPDCCDEVWTDIDGTDVTDDCNPEIACDCTSDTKTCNDFDECESATCSLDCCTAIWTDDYGNQYEECPDCSCVVTVCEEGATCSDYPDAICTQDCCEEVWTDSDGTDVSDTCSPEIMCKCTSDTKTCSDYDDCSLAACSMDCCTTIWTDDDGNQYEKCPDPKWNASSSMKLSGFATFSLVFAIIFK